MTHFNLHPQLERDSFFIQKLSLSQARLMNNALFPWIILIPEIPSAVELIDLSIEHQHIILEEINQISTILRKNVDCTKLNIAALGNQVSQLHIHIIARTIGDAAWPRSE